MILEGEETYMNLDNIFFDFTHSTVERGTSTTKIGNEKNFQAAEVLGY